MLRAFSVVRLGALKFVVVRFLAAEGRLVRRGTPPDDDDGADSASVVNPNRLLVGSSILGRFERRGIWVRLFALEDDSKDGRVVFRGVPVD